MKTLPEFDQQFIVAPVSQHLRAQLQRRIDTKTKPVGALGRLEDLAMQLGLIQQTLQPQLVDSRVIVFAADHGIAAENVSAYPQEVTGQMVGNFLAGGAAVNVLAREAGMSVQIVNAGVSCPFDAHPQLTEASIASGTKNSAVEPAMTAAQATQAILKGRAIAHDSADAGCTVLALGEMGIANTSAAALLLAKISGLSLATTAGRGTGLDDIGLAHKLAVLERAAARTEPQLTAFDALVEYGGFEIAMMAGAMIGAAQRSILILIDGFIATSALLVARAIAPAITDYAVFTHRSNESGHQAMLDILGGKPLLALDLRLGEGTGAVLAYPLIRAAAAFLEHMASFESAQVSAKAVQAPDI